MIPFAVSIEGVTEEGQAQWALAADAESILTANADGSLEWYPLTKCKFVKLVSPELPKPVFVVQPQPQNGAVIVPNRAECRRIEREGG